MSATISAPSSSSSRPASSDAGPLVEPRVAAGMREREHLLDRLDRLRVILPAFAEELASSRRQAAALRVENRGLLAEVRRLQRESAVSVRSRTAAAEDAPRLSEGNRS